MKYFSIYIEDLESERFISSSHDQIATWLLLHTLCSKQMNSGIIQGASSLPERFWSRHGVSVDIINKPSPLWEWNGEDLILTLYDIDGQALYEKKVAGGKAGGRGRKNRSPNRTPNRTPDREETILEETRPEEKRSPNQSSSDEGGSLFPEAGSSASKKNGHELFDYWNTFTELAKIKDVTAKRKAQLNARLKEDFFRENWKSAITKISQTPFLKGNNNRGWKADIDWLLTPGNLVKIIEGKYDNQPSKPPTTVNTGGRDTTNTEQV